MSKNTEMDVIGVDRPVSQAPARRSPTRLDAQPTAAARLADFAQDPMRETNLLTDAVFDPYSRQPAYKACAVRIDVVPHAG